MCVSYQNKLPKFRLQGKTTWGRNVRATFCSVVKHIIIIYCNAEYGLILHRLTKFLGKYFYVSYKVDIVVVMWLSQDTLPEVHNNVHSGSTTAVKKGIWCDLLTLKRYF